MDCSLRLFIGERTTSLCLTSRPSIFFQDALFVRVRLIVCFHPIAEKYSVMASSQIAFLTTFENINSHFSSRLCRLVVSFDPASPTKSFSTLILCLIFLQLLRTSSSCSMPYAQEEGPIRSTMTEKQRALPSHNLWPEDDPPFKRESFAYYTVLITFARKMIRIFALELSESEEYITAPNTSYKKILYPPQEAEKVEGAHTDFVCHPPPPIRTLKIQSNVCRLYHSLPRQRRRSRSP